jgi:hypothetical protein
VRRITGLLTEGPGPTSSPGSLPAPRVACHCSQAGSGTPGGTIVIIIVITIFIIIVITIFIIFDDFVIFVNFVSCGQRDGKG